MIRKYYAFNVFDKQNLIICIKYLYQGGENYKMQIVKCMSIWYFTDPFSGICYLAFVGKNIPNCKNTP